MSLWYKIKVNILLFVGVLGFFVGTLGLYYINIPISNNTSMISFTTGSYFIYNKIY